MTDTLSPPALTDTASAAVEALRTHRGAHYLDSAHTQWAHDTLLAFSALPAILHREANWARDHSHAAAEAYLDAAHRVQKILDGGVRPDAQ